MSETMQIKEIGRLKDDLWPFEGYDHIRYTARGIVISEEGKYGFLHIQGEDYFGVRDHLETCGGGIEEGEYADDALQREVLEEMGYHVKEYELLGAIIDTYNLLKRITYSVFFVCRVDTREEVHTNRTEAEQILVKEVVWLDLDEAIDRLENHCHSDVDLIVQRRDAMALHYYIDHYLEKKDE